MAQISRSSFLGKNIVKVARVFRGQELWGWWSRNGAYELGTCSDSDRALWSTEWLLRFLDIIAQKESWALLLLTTLGTFQQSGGSWTLENTCLVTTYLISLYKVIN